MLVGGRHAREMGGVHHEHRVELVPDRGTRLDVLHAGEQQCGEERLVAEAAVDALGDDFEQILARRLFDETDDRFHVGLQAERVFGKLRLGRGDGGELREEVEIAETGEGAECGAAAQEGAS